MSKITGKDRRPSSLVYNAYMEQGFPTVALAASQTDATVQARIPLALNVKIIAIAVGISGGAAGTASMNVALGAGTMGAVATQRNQGTIAGAYPEDIQATAGQKLFAADQAVTMTDDTVTTLYNSVNPNVVWPAGSELTLRLTTNGSAAGNLQVRLITSPVDQNPMSPEQYAQAFVPSASTI